MTTAAFPLRSTVGLPFGAASLRTSPRFGGQSDASVQTAWFFGGAAPASADFVLASTLEAVTLAASISAPYQAALSATLSAVTLASTFEATYAATLGLTLAAVVLVSNLDFGAGATPAPLTYRGSGRRRGRVRAL